MSALTLLIIRHAEKPNENEPDAGLTIEGTRDDKSLIIRGWQRSGAWATLFGTGLGGENYPQPDVVYAADPDQEDDSTDSEYPRSKRPYETIQPLCDRLHLEPVTKWGAGQEADLVSEVVKLTGVVLICWEHKRIMDGILPEITKQQSLATVPSKWNGQRFDVVLRFYRLTEGSPWSFRQLFPRVLSGDSDVPLGK